MFYFRNARHVEPLTAPECDLHVSFQKCETRVQYEVTPECDIRVSLLKRESHVQSYVSKFESELGSPHPHGFEANFSATDLRNYLTRKKSIHQIAHKCHCEQLILTVLSDYH